MTIVHVEITGAQKTLVCHASSIDDLKNKIQEKEGYNPEHMRFENENGTNLLGDSLSSLPSELRTRLFLDLNGGCGYYNHNGDKGFCFLCIFWCDTDCQNISVCSRPE
mmetsp:Transcript_43974/g.61807  ORF Transcript_43974/g.61807 Transcript_43974/m.61807 type:complete len:108 (+) Transcript_43974:57-380(+)